MKIRILVLAFVLMAAAIAAFSLFESADAGDNAQQVIPIVNVDPTGSLSIVSGTDPGNGNAIDFGYTPAGYTQTSVLVLSVSANDTWRLVVSKSQDLTDASTSEFIPSSNFTFTSDGPAGPTYVTSDTEFGTIATPANVVGNGSATTESAISVNYKLVLPDSQLVGYYSAPHTYTLILE